MQLRHLIRFLELEYTTAGKEHERMRAQGRVSFDMLWTFLVPGVNVVFRSPYTEDDMCGKGRKAVKLEVYKYDCKSFDSENVWSEVVLYGGEKPFGQPVHLSLRLDCGVARQVGEAIPGPGSF